ncbi:MAG TPA: M20 family peptidase [Candidatus Microthrix parvicella]|jgi:amidohydrolase|uniref:Peptidase M20 domain-containing protein 2 n=2 Tax=Candidatus Neomicrothrix TaxID=41949 RepID=R4Z1G4_9ACTN|nr:putative Peptidase M20 domain-containing protein 2 [Candidatus Microthrix parvicella RN1]HBX09180.1 M20 family peptidase [Candidatus Microthrix parvicella]
MMVNDASATPHSIGQTAAHARVAEEIDRLADRLLDVSHRIHADPELAYAEYHAHDLLCGVLEEAGLHVTRGAYGLDTAFEARVGGGSGPTVAIICEYDALPGIGHACGHNIIAAAGLGAALGASSVVEELDGNLVVLGTPAEEGGGGKIAMIDAGALLGVDAAMMVHPSSADVESMYAIAVQQVKVTYHGKASHAAAHPELGRNALDAAVLGYSAVGALRQHIAPDERIHGIFTEAGDQPNVVPRRAAAHYYVRSGTLARLEQLKPRVLASLEGGALSAGCEMEVVWVDSPYAELVHNATLGARYSAHAALLGRSVAGVEHASLTVGSTDMGNVSLEVPSIHPTIAAAPPDSSIHTEAFAVAAASPSGDLAVLDGAKAMAGVAVDLWADPSVLTAATEEWRSVTH